MLGQSAFHLPVLGQVMCCLQLGEWCSWSAGQVRRKSNCCPSQQARSGGSGMEVGTGCVAGKQLENILSVPCFSCIYMVRMLL